MCLQGLLCAREHHTNQPMSPRGSGHSPCSWSPQLDWDILALQLSAVLSLLLWGPGHPPCRPPTHPGTLRGAGWGSLALHLLSVAWYERSKPPSPGRLRHLLHIRISDGSEILHVFLLYTCSGQAPPCAAAQHGFAARRPQPVSKARSRCQWLYRGERSVSRGVAIFP